MEQKLNSGVLFKNEKKTEKHPDYTGSLKTESGDFQMAAWVKQGKKGPFLSVSITKKEVKNDLPF